MITLNEGRVIISKYPVLYPMIKLFCHLHDLKLGVLHEIFSYKTENQNI